LKIKDNSYEKVLLERLKEGDKTAFSCIFTVYYSDLVMFACIFTKNLDISEEIVQNIFVKFWEDRELLTINTSLKSFLLRAVRNRSIDWLRHLKIRDKYSADILETSSDFENDVENYVFASELEHQIEKALTKLPEEISNVFRMNRYDGLKYHEIAEKLNVSVRTIEVRIGKALHLLREHLKDFLVTLAVLSHFIKY
jgi:RNA polymerase sigma-70 factor, Bacteroides expansion family 1